ncbi:MAG: hypothetical protein ACOCUH_04050 [Bacteriovoracia bacterium]
MRWFKHYCDASTSIKVNQIIDECGLEGYARWFLLLELLSEKFDGESTKFEIHFNEISAKVRIKFSKKLETFLKLLHNFSLIELEVKGKVYKIDCPILMNLQDRDFKKSRKNRGTDAPKIKNKIKNKDKEEEREYSARKPLVFPGSKNELPINPAELINLYNEIYGSAKNRYHRGFLFGEHLENLKATVSHEPFNTLEGWKELFEIARDSEFFNGKGFCNLLWLINPANATKTLNGMYKDQKQQQGGVPRVWTEDDFKDCPAGA